MELPNAQFDENYATNLINLISWSYSQQHSQNETLYTYLPYYLQNPLFSFYLIKFFLDESLDISVRFGACTLFRSYFQYIPDELLDNFKQLIPQILSLFQDEFLWRQISATMASILVFFRQKNIPFELDEFIFQQLDNPETVPAALTLLYEITNYKIYMNMPMFERVAALLDSDFIENALKVLENFAKGFEKTIHDSFLSLLLENFEEMSLEGQKSVARIAISVFNDYKTDQALAEFIIKCITHEDETISIEAANVFQNSMVPFYSEAIEALSDKIATDTTMLGYNMSVQCFDSLKYYMKTYNKKGLEYLLPQIGQWSQSQEILDVRKAIRCYAAIAPFLEDIDSVLSEVSQFAETFPADVAFFFKEVAMEYPPQIPSILEALYQMLDFDDSDLTAQVFDSINTLLPLQKFDGTPFLPIIHQLLTSEIPSDFVNYVYSSTCLFCESAVDLDGEEETNGICEHSLSTFNNESNDSIKCADSLHILAALLPKVPSIAAEIIEGCSTKLIQILTQETISDSTMLINTLRMLNSIAQTELADPSIFESTLPILFKYLDIDECPGFEKEKLCGEAWKTLGSYLIPAAPLIAQNIEPIFEFFSNINERENLYLISGISCFWSALIKVAPTESFMTEDLITYAIDLFYECVRVDLFTSESDPLRQNIVFALLQTFGTYIEQISPNEEQMHQIFVTKSFVQEELVDEWNEIIEVILSSHPEFEGLMR